MMEAKEQVLWIKIDAKASQYDVDKVVKAKANREDLDILKSDIREMRG